MEQKYLIDTNVLIDAIIAATVPARNLILVTNNEQDFKAIHNLTVINPHSL
jgi:predicted nucleic acid-binding protein